jgi:hypothetical protein
MKRLVLIASIGMAFAAPATAQSSHYVRGHVTKNGTYVAPHYQTNPDSSVLNNWSTKGNVNPYTGKPGTIDPYSSPKPKPKTYGYSPYGNTDSSDDEPK